MGKLEENEIKYSLRSFRISEEKESELVELSKHYNVYFAKEGETYYMLLIKNLEQEPEILKKIENHGGTEFGKSV